MIKDDNYNNNVNYKILKNSSNSMRRGKFTLQITVSLESLSKWFLAADEQ